MKKLMMTVIAGSLCAAFGSAFAQGTPGPSGAQATPSSKTGVQTPKQTDDTRMDVGKGAKGASAGASTSGSASTGGSTAGSSTAGSSTTGSSASSSSGMGTDTGATERKGRRAARREKG